MTITIDDKVKKWFHFIILKGNVVTGYNYAHNVDADNLHNKLMQEGIIYKHQLLTNLFEYRLTNIGKSIHTEIKKQKKKLKNESKSRKTVKG